MDRFCRKLVSFRLSVNYTRCQCYKTFYCSNLLPCHGDTIILYYKMILLWYLPRNVGIKYHGNLPWYFNLRKRGYCSKLPWYFYNTGHSILTLEKGGTTVNYGSIFITLCPGWTNTIFLRDCSIIWQTH